MSSYLAIIQWLEEYWLEIIIAIVLAILAAPIGHFIYSKKSGKTKLSQGTVPLIPCEVLVKLTLPNNIEIKVKESKQIIGREYFANSVSYDDLPLISKKHFMILRENNNFYIEDLNSRNGTKVNGEEIKGLGRKKLEDGDELLIANSVKVGVNLHVK